MRDLVDVDPLTGVYTWHHYDAHTDETIIETTQDVNSILERNKVLHKTPEHSRHGLKESFWHVASIPLVLIEKWKREEGIDAFNKAHAKRVIRKLNDPEYRYLRTSRGRV